MPPNDELPLSKSDPLAEVDAELESAMSQLDEMSDRVDRAITNFEEGDKDLEDAKPETEDENTEPETEDEDTEPEEKEAAS